MGASVPRPSRLFRGGLATRDYSSLMSRDPVASGVHSPLLSDIEQFLRLFFDNNNHDR